MVVTAILRALLDGTGCFSSVGVVGLLVNGHIHFFDQQAVSWDAVSGGENKDVTNDEVVDKHGLGGTVLASENGAGFSHDLSSEAEELLLLSVVAKGSDEGGEEDSEVDAHSFEPHVRHIGPEGEEEVEGRKDQESLVEEVLELVPKDGSVRSNCWKGSLIFSETKNIQSY